MSHVLKLGHQPADLPGVLPGNPTTSTDFFFSEYDVNGLRFVGDRDEAFPFFAQFPAPMGDLWIQFVFRAPNETTRPRNATRHLLVLYDASQTVIARIVADTSDDNWRAEVHGDTTETGNLLGLDELGTYWFNIQLVVGANIELRVHFGDVLVSQAIAANSGGAGKPVRCDFPNTGLHSSHLNRNWGYAHFAFLDGVSTIGRRFIRRVPSVAGVHTDWAGSVDAIADGRVETRMTSDTPGQRQSATLAGPSVPSGAAIAAVHLQAVAQGGTDGVQGLAGSLRIAGADHDAPAETIGIETPETVTYTWPQNPATSADWTDADLPDEIGLLSAT